MRCHHVVVVEYLDGASNDVAVMRQAGGERRAVIERELGQTAVAFTRRVEGIDRVPVRQSGFLGLGEREVLGHCSKRRSAGTALSTIEQQQEQQQQR